MVTSLVPAGVIPAVKAKCAEVVGAFPGITHVYGFAPWPDHNNRRCIDFMVYNSEKPASANLSRAEQVKLGDAVVAYLLANRKRLDVNGIIWNRRVIDGDIGDGAYRGPEAVSRPYSGNDPHTDHVHVEFGSAVYVPPAGAPVVEYPMPTSGEVYLDKVRPGVTNSDTVAYLQTWLAKVLGIPLARTGTYDAATVAAATRYQRDVLGDDPKFCDGVLGQLQTSALATAAGARVTIYADSVTGGQVWPPLPPTPKPPTVPDVKPDQPEEPAVTSAVETIMGLNILRRTDTEPGRKRWGTRKPLLGQHLRDAHASVYLLIETDESTRKDLGAELGPEFTWWGYKYHGIYWRQSVWERVGDATNEAALGENRFLLSLPLRHKATGRVVTFDVTHLENDGDPTTDGHRARYSETSRVVSLASRGDRVGFFDCNSTTTVATATAKTANTRQRQKPRGVLARAGASFLSEIKGKVAGSELATHHGGKGSTPRGAWIDDAWVMGDVELVDGAVVRTDGTDASDHHGLKFRIRF